MMVTEHICLSSSDDEDDSHEPRKNMGLQALLTVSKVFGIVDVDDDDDDVRIIEKPMNIVVGKRDRGRTIKNTTDDDECCILDADPAATATTDIDAPIDSEELVMTGEKGPVACRDFPHARYLCVHLPFRNGNHAKFCAQCHCYVCDALAPCSQWGDGSLSTDHCHASDKEARWKSLRKISKCSVVSQPVIPTTATNLMGGDRIFRQTVATVAQVASTLSNNGGSVNEERVNSGVCTGFFESPINQPHVGTPVGPGVFRRVQEAVAATTTTTPSPPMKRDPLVIKLKGKGRGGKPFQQPPYLGVRTRPQRGVSQSSFPAHRPLPTQRPTYGHTGRAPPGGGLHHQEGSYPFQCTVNTNLASQGLGFNIHPPYVPPPPPPSEPPPPTPPPPPPLPVDEYEQMMMRLDDGGAESNGGANEPMPPVGSHHVVPESRYVSAGAFSVQQQQACHVNLQPCYSDCGVPPMCSEPSFQHLDMKSIGQEYGSNPIAQEYCQPIIHPIVHPPQYSTTSSRFNPYHHGEAIDGTVAGHTEGWVVDATTAPFGTFPSGISVVVESLGDGQQAGISPSLNEVLESMAGDDYLWEQYPIFT